MQKTATAAQMRALDHQAIFEWGIPSLVLMENAAAAVTQQALSFCRPPYGQQTVVCFCGTGNNGGDGFAAARQLLTAGCKVRLFLVGDPAKATPDSQTMQQRLREAGGSIERYTPAAAKAALAEPSVACVIDALFGVGLSRPLAGDFFTVVQQINAAKKPVVACDLPSGIDTDTGAVLGAAVQAACTVTFTCAKPGLYQGAGLAHAGRVEIAEIGIPQALVEAIPMTVLPEKKS